MKSHPYRPGKLLVGFAVACFAVGILIDLTSATSNFMQLRMLRSAADGALISDDAAMVNDLRQGLVALVNLGVYIATAVAFCMWVFRANKNARALGAANMEYTPGWTVGWFFIPFANLVKPYHAVREIWLASNPLADPHDGTSWKESKDVALVTAWWLAWIFTNVAINIATRVVSTNAQSSIEEFITETKVSLALDLAIIPARILALLVCLGLYRRLELRAFAVREARTSEAPTL